jgi:hypothetical protein
MKVRILPWKRLVDRFLGAKTGYNVIVYCDHPGGGDMSCQEQIAILCQITFGVSHNGVSLAGSTNLVLIVIKNSDVMLIAKGTPHQQGPFCRFMNVTC